MKYWATALAILAALSASLALAEDFTTTNGKEYKNAAVIRVDPDGIVIKTESGILKISFSELPKEVQERFHYDPAKAAQFNAATAQQQAPAQAPTQAEENVRNIREVETDQRSFFDQTFSLKGTIEVCDYYNYGYREAEPTHYAFAIRHVEIFFPPSKISKGYDLSERRGARCRRSNAVWPGRTHTAGTSIVIFSRFCL